MMGMLILASCGSSSRMGDVSSPEDFELFYDRFHKDVDFQMSRIIFPLEGKSVDAEGERIWTKENWIPMKVKIYDVDQEVYDIDYRKTEDSFMQKFWLPGTGFSAEYRFKKINGKWFLVFAEDTNL